RTGGEDSKKVGGALSLSLSLSGGLGSVNAHSSRFSLSWFRNSLSSPTTYGPSARLDPRKPEFVSAPRPLSSIALSPTARTPGSPHLAAVRERRPAAQRRSNPAT
ncbi:hypothetical protein CRG98_049623, partial [Punica granatum]